MTVIKHLYCIGAFFLIAYNGFSQSTHFCLGMPYFISSLLVDGTESSDCSESIESNQIYTNWVMPEVIITGIIDGDLSGGNPKAVELYISGTVDLSNYRMERSTNGGAFGSSFDLSGVYTDEFVYVISTSGEARFDEVFGTGTANDDFGNRILSGNISGNGNDAFRILESSTIIDQVAPMSSADSYKDSYLYRMDCTGPDGGWTATNWTIPGNGILDGLDAAGHTAAVPFGTYQYTCVPEPEFAIAPTDADKAEGNTGTSNFTFTVTRSNVTTGTATLDYIVAGATTDMADAADFGGAFPSGIVSFADGETEQIITIEVTGDTDFENDEGFVVTLSNPSSGSITQATANGIIQNDDTAFFILALDAVKEEGNAGNTAFTFRVSRQGNTSGVATIDYATSGNTANADDFGGTFPAGTISFADGEGEQTLTIDVSGDIDIENDEEFVITISNPSQGTVTSSTAGGTIQNDDASYTIMAVDADKVEGNAGTTNFTFDVIRTGSTSSTGSIDYSVAAGTFNPVDTDDFGGTFPSGTLSFAADTPTETMTIIIPVTGDTDPENTEDFIVTLSNPNFGLISTSSAEGTIQNDDSPTLAPTFDIAADDANKLEGNAGTTNFTFIVTRSDFLTGIESVDYAVIGSGTNPANESDFENNMFPMGTVNFAALQATETITIPVNGDIEAEADEIFTVVLSNPSAGVINTSKAQGTIQNEDVVEVSIMVAPVSELEGSGNNLVYTFTRIGSTTGDLLVRFSTSGDATNGSVDYTVIGAANYDAGNNTGNIIIPDGFSTADLIINLINDDSLEGDETVTVTVENPN